MSDTNIQNTLSVEEAKVYIIDKIKELEAEISNLSSDYIVGRLVDEAQYLRLSTGKSVSEILSA